MNADAFEIGGLGRAAAPVSAMPGARTCRQPESVWRSSQGSVGLYCRRPSCCALRKGVIMSMHMHGTPLHSRSQASDSLHVEASESLRAAVEALLCTWKRTGEMQKADPSDADCPAWDVAAIRKMVLSDVQCRQIWQRGDPGGRLKINDTFSQIVRASVNKVFGVEQVLAKAIGLRNPRLGHLQSRISSEARLWADLNVSEELRASWQAAQQRSA